MGQKSTAKPDAHNEAGEGKAEDHLQFAGAPPPAFHNQRSPSWTWHGHVLDSDEPFGEASGGPLTQLSEQMGRQASARVAYIVSAQVQRETRLERATPMAWIQSTSLIHASPLHLSSE